MILCVYLFLIYSHGFALNNAAVLANVLSGLGRAGRQCLVGESTTNRDRHRVSSELVLWQIQRVQRGGVSVLYECKPKLSVRFGWVEREARQVSERFSRAIGGDLIVMDFYMVTSDFSMPGGFLSSSIGVFTKLRHLGLQGMPNIGGTLPTELSLLTALTFLYVDGCSFTGTLPSITNIPGLAVSGSCSIVSNDRECVRDSLFGR
jgi:hypothetical protein